MKALTGIGGIREHPACSNPVEKQGVLLLVHRTQEGWCDMSVAQRNSSNPSSPPVAASVFALPGLLPDGIRLLVDPVTRCVIVIPVIGMEPDSLLRSFPLSPSATHLFLALLRAYPHHCSYHALFRTLYPCASGITAHNNAWDRQIMRHAVRRARKALMPVLRECGLQALAVRDQGYVLAAASKANKNVRKTRATGKALIGHKHGEKTNGEDHDRTRR